MRNGELGEQLEKEGITHGHEHALRSILRQNLDSLGDGLRGGNVISSKHVYDDSSLLASTDGADGLGTGGIKDTGETEEADILLDFLALSTFDLEAGLERSETLAESDDTETLGGELLSLVGEHLTGGVGERGGGRGVGVGVRNVSRRAINKTLNLERENR